MKHFRLLPLLAFFIFGCSSDEPIQTTQSKAPDTHDAPQQLESRVTPECLLFFDVGATTVSGSVAALWWDTSTAVYSANTTSRFEVAELLDINCSITGPSGTVQNFPINAFSPATGSVNIIFGTHINSKCFKWRFVNQGKLEGGQKCLTATPWQVYSY